jgi:hypothetical protein
MDSASTLWIRLPLTLSALAAMLTGCAVGCLYHESGQVVVVSGESPPSPERIVEVVGASLRPLGFAGRVANNMTPRPPWYWDYEFSVGVGKFAPRERVDVFIKYDDVSITLSDFARNSRASAFDHSVMEAIQARLRSELGADISFTHPATPALCLGP